MTITLEPFAKLDAVCAGCGRSASVARISFPFDRDRHVFCPSCLADLHRLTAPTAPVLTVGAALALPEVQRGEAVVVWPLPTGDARIVWYRVGPGKPEHCDEPTIVLSVRPNRRRPVQVRIHRLRDGISVWSEHSSERAATAEAERLLHGDATIRLDPGDLVEVVDTETPTTCPTCGRPTEGT